MQVSDFIQYNGYQLKINSFLTDGYIQKRTHRKHRINKKWRKRYGLKCAWDMQRVIVMDKDMFVSPGLYKKLVKAFTQKEGD